MSSRRRIARAFSASLIGAVVGTFTLTTDGHLRAVNDTIWVANRLASVSTIRGFDATTGDVVRTVSMAPNSQPGDLAYAKGKLYVSEEFGTPPAVAIVVSKSGVQEVQPGRYVPGRYTMTPPVLLITIV